MRLSNKPPDAKTLLTLGALAEESKVLVVIRVPGLSGLLHYSSLHIGSITLSMSKLAESPSKDCAEERYRSQKGYSHAKNFQRHFGKAIEKLKQL